MKKNIVLIGMPGCGKSTVGVVLAKKIGFAFLDSDLVIQEKYGKLLHELIEENGLDGFRDIENEVNASLSCEKTVIATGGSVVYGTQAMKNFQERDFVVYLQLPCAEIEARLGDLNERGVIIKEGQTLWNLYEERKPLYEKYGGITIHCAGKTIKDIVSEIAQKYEEQK